MNRRKFVGLLVGAPLPGSSIARAQSPRLPIIGMLNSSKTTAEIFLEQFRRDMRALGWEEERNFQVMQRWPVGGSEEMPELARELVANGVSVIFAGAGAVAIRAAQNATTSLPIVGMTDDMVGSGLVASFARPGGNTTGLSILASELDVKRLGLLHELLPTARRIGVLADPTTISTRHELETTARGLSIDLVHRTAANSNEILATLEEMASLRIEAINVLASAILNSARRFIIERLAALAIPAVYQWPETAEEGGLMGYGPRITLCYRHVAVFIDKILRGSKPPDLPIEQPSVFTLAINLKTAKVLGLPVPPSLLLRADELIQ
jgi:putative tryptophan/tyrosine transport system substrate-binding protein